MLAMSRRAVATLIAVALQESLLHSVQRVRRAESFDGRDLVSIVHEFKVIASRSRSFNCLIERVPVIRVNSVTNSVDC